jgi:hypothetical protein
LGGGRDQGLLGNPSGGSALENVRIVNTGYVEKSVFAAYGLPQLCFRVEPGVRVIGARSRFRWRLRR